MQINQISSYKAFGGYQSVYEHISTACGNVPMRFSIFTPPTQTTDPLPVLFILAGMGTDGELAATMYGGQEMARKHGIILVYPDVSPRAGVSIPAPNQLVGEGYSHYVNATREPWHIHYRMYDYIHTELPLIITQNFDADRHRIGYTGFASGGSMALIMGIRNPSMVTSISAISPIASLIESAWGDAIIPQYFNNESESLPYDLVQCIHYNGCDKEMMVDIASDDMFVLDVLKPKLLVDAIEQTGGNLHLRVHEGYDHDYWMARTFLPHHIKYHAEKLA